MDDLLGSEHILTEAAFVDVWSACEDVIVDKPKDIRFNAKKALAKASPRWTAALEGVYRLTARWAMTGSVLEGGAEALHEKLTVRSRVCDRQLEQILRFTCRDALQLPAARPVDPMRMCHRSVTSPL